jgi:hypothetical protein
MKIGWEPLALIVLKGHLMESLITGTGTITSCIERVDIGI